MTGIDDTDGNGNGNGNGRRRFVTNADLAAKLALLRWEMRFYILAALVGAKVLPTDVTSLAGAVLGWFR